MVAEASMPDVATISTAREHPISVCMTVGTVVTSVVAVQALPVLLQDHVKAVDSRMDTVAGMKTAVVADMKTAVVAGMKMDVVVESTAAVVAGSVALQVPDLTAIAVLFLPVHSETVVLRLPAHSETAVLRPLVPMVTTVLHHPGPLAATLLPAHTAAVLPLVPLAAALLPALSVAAEADPAVLADHIAVDHMVAACTAAALTEAVPHMVAEAVTSEVAGNLDERVRPAFRVRGS